LGEHPRADELNAVVREFDCLPKVPRKIKGYANLLTRFKPHLDDVRTQHKESGDDPARWAQLAVTYTYLYHFHHRIYRLLWNNGQELWDQLRRWCAGEPNRLKAQLEHLELREEVPKSKSGAADESEREATAEIGLEPETVFHDPAADNVLHVEALIQAIGPISEEEAEWHLLQWGSQVS